MAGKKKSGSAMIEFLKAFAQSRRRRPPPRGGSEPVTVEPNRPKLGEGGAAAALEFDD